MTQTSTSTPTGAQKWGTVLFSVILVTSFLLPWVKWGDHSLSGSDFALGKFFDTTATAFNIANPFPQYAFINYLFLIIPAAALAAIFLALQKKNTSIAAYVAGAFALGLVVVYFRFAETLEMLAYIPSAQKSLQLGFFFTAISAFGLIISGLTRANIVVKLLLLAVPLAAAWFSFSAMSSYLENKSFDETATLKPSYTIEALDLIKEYNSNDSTANKKYRNNVLLVRGNISELELPNDSTVNVKIADTTGSYVIFPFYGKNLSSAKSLKQGDAVKIKAVCSGDTYSEILESRVISFERCYLDK